jgi:hypothetical protein
MGQIMELKIENYKLIPQYRTKVTNPSPFGERVPIGRVRGCLYGI